jgi:hypothetical protein
MRWQLGLVRESGEVPDVALEGTYRFAPLLAELVT